MPNLRRGTPVYVEWDDSASFGGWRGDTHGMTTGQVKSVGFVFGVNNDGLILTTSLAKSPPDPDIIAALDTLIIPHGCIRRIQVLDMKGEPAPIQIEGVQILRDEYGTYERFEKCPHDVVIGQGQDCKACNEEPTLEATVRLNTS